MHNTLKRALLAATICSTVLVAAAAGAAATPLGRAEPMRSVAFDVLLPLHDAAGLDALLAKQQDPASPSYHRWLTPAQFGSLFGPDAATIGRVAANLRARGFTVTTQTRSLHVTGAASQVEALFATHLMVATTDEGLTHVVTDGALHMPADLAAAGAQVFSFSPHVAHTMSRQVSALQPTIADNRTSAVGPYWFDDLKQAYSYPSVQATVTVKGQTLPFNGTGVTIGVLMSSDVNDSDIKAMFDNEKWSTVTGTPDPVLYQHIAINGGGGLKGPALPEASLDTQQALGGAPGAHVVLYNIPDLSDGNIFAGYINIVESNLVDAVSSSFGGCELAYFPSYNAGQDYRGVLKAQHEIFQQGNSQGITFLASSGDGAGLSCPTLPYLAGGKGHFIPSVSEPASDPNVTAVGGTNLVTAFTSGSLDSTYASENAWSDPEVAYDPYGTGGSAKGGVWGAGGGYSAMWQQPIFQKGLTTGSTKRRAVPDIGMQVGGCPSIAIVASAPPYCDGGNNPLNGAGNTQRSAVWVAINVDKPKGGFGAYIGTSVASPELLSAVALLEENNGSRYGNLNYQIYGLATAQANGAPAFYHTGIAGYNGVKNSLIAPSYSLSTGVGTPIVNSWLLQPSLPVAGVPQTTSNP